MAGHRQYDNMSGRDTGSKVVDHTDVLETTTLRPSDRGQRAEPQKIDDLTRKVQMKVVIQYSD